MTNLISGKEALIALANGEEVQGNIGSEWVDITVDQKLSIKSFITETNDYGCAVKFRLKPQTITIESFEFKGSVSMEKHSDNISIRFSNKDDCARWHNALRQIFK